MGSQNRKTKQLAADRTEYPVRSFVTKHDRRNNIEYWDGGPDNLKAWKKNRKNLGPDWYYYDKGPDVISYIRNEDGFREKSKDNIDWSNYVIIFGCSIVEGIGNTVDDTISKNLERIIDTPVLNFGCSGGSVDQSCINSLILHNDYPRPKAVIHIWTGLARYADFLQNLNCKQYLPRMKTYDPTYMWEERSKFYVEADRALWHDKTIYLEGSTFYDTAKVLDVPFYKEVDRARDTGHPGYKTNKLIAENLADRLKEQGLT